MGEPVQISRSVDRGWQIAADFAAQSGSATIEPLHMLYGIFSAEKAASGSSAADPECEEVQSWLQAAGLDAAALRRAIRAKLASSARKPAVPQSGGRIRRSDRTRDAFERAAASETARAQGTLQLLPLATELVLLLDPAEEAALGESAVALRTRAKVPSSGRPQRSLSNSIWADRAAPPLILEKSIDASVAARPPAEIAQKLALLSELTWEFGTGKNIEPYLQKFLERLLPVLTIADRGAILLYDSSSKNWLLKAHVLSSSPRLSMSSIQRAVEQKQALIWTRGEDISRSQEEAKLQSGIYAPLIADQKVIGVIVIDSSKTGEKFEDDDLALVVAASHQLALAIANHELNASLKKNGEVLEHLLVNFSPKLRKRILERANQGRLPLGGERSSVSILCSDIRGFTLLSAAMDVREVVDMLNDYFSALVECILAQDGTVDKFIGDAILAVFGSPEPDPQHCMKAVSVALEMQRTMDTVTARRNSSGLKTCRIGIGIHTGEVLHGFIGSPERMEYTVIGDTVNRAARYCDGARAGQIFISPEVFEQVWSRVDAEKVITPTKHEGDLAAYWVKDLRA